MKKISLFFRFALLFWIFSAVGCSSFQPISDSGNDNYGPGSDLREAIVEYALEYEGSKYKYAGNGPKSFDCSGFTCYVMRKFDISLNRVSASQEQQGRPVSASRARPGDLVFFRKHRGGKVFHVALVISNGPEGIRVIHATSSRGVVIDNIEESSYWSSKYATLRNVVDP